VMGVADTPRRLREAEEALQGLHGSPEAAAEFTEVVRACVTPESDIHVSAEYRKNLIGVLAEKAFTTAWTRAAGHTP
jgi:CO/xanthine dehydrogenase FAD-binding subunit